MDWKQALNWKNKMFDFESNFLGVKCVIYSRVSIRIKTSCYKCVNNVDDSIKNIIGVFTQT